MKIEAGQFYQTRDGRKVRIYAVDETDTYFIHGAIFSPSAKKWVICSWNSGGRVFENYTHSNDIVAEWVDPHPAESWPVDAKIFVRDCEGKPWEPRHFAKYENGYVFAWVEGKTSFTTSRFYAWAEAKLAEDI